MHPDKRLELIPKQHITFPQGSEAAVRS